MKLEYKKSRVRLHLFICIYISHLHLVFVYLYILISYQTKQNHNKALDWSSIFDLSLSGSRVSFFSLQTFTIFNKKKKKKRRKEKSKQTLACTTFTFRLVILSINRSSSSKEVTGVFIFDYHHQFTDLSVHLKNLTKNNKSFP
jgi:hypothetical protein